MTKNIPSSTRVRLLMASAALLLTPSLAFAQAPNDRPGLILFGNDGQPISQTTPAPSLVQRDYTGQSGQGGQTAGVGAGTAPGGQAVAQQAAPSEQFFFIEDGAAGPSELASGLSNMNSDTMVQTGSQLQGNYGDLQRSSSPAGQIQEAWARPFENMSQGQAAPGTVKFQWSTDMVMPLRLRDGMLTNIIIPDWDEAVDVVIGNDSTIEGKIIRGNAVAIRPLSVGRDTSVTIYGGSGNVYSFYARTEGVNTQVVTDLQVFVLAAPSKGSVDWFNDQNITTGGSGSGGLVPLDQDGGDHSAIVRRRSASQGEELVPVDRRIFDMKMYEVNKGDRIIAPDYIYSDGKFTYFHFPAGMTDRPVIRRIVDGVEGRVNSRVGGRHNEIVVVEAVGDFILRSGTRAVCAIQVDERGAVVRR